MISELEKNLLAQCLKLDAVNLKRRPSIKPTIIDQLAECFAPMTKQFVPCTQKRCNYLYDYN
jgi:hypothetical protein